MMMTVICYETKQGDTYLAYYTYKTKEEAQQEVNELNTTKPAKLWNGELINWANIDHYFVDEQEEMY